MQADSGKDRNDAAGRQRHRARDGGASVGTPGEGGGRELAQDDGSAAVQTLRWGQGGSLLVEDAAPAAAPPRSVAPTGDRVQLPGFERRVAVKGSTLGSDYIRRELPTSREFRRLGDDAVQATEATLAARSPVGRALQRAKQVLIGNRLATELQVNERLTKVKALAVLSSDAISSVAYATEASLGVLIVAGSGALQINLVLAACIVLLMIVVGTSYFQTIHAYPHGGGSYIVARDNLGDLAGLVAAAALLIDYVLTVSVSISSGVDALTTAVPSLSWLDVPLGVFFILVIMIVNLRGIRESGSIFAGPTYLFISAFLIMIVAGVLHALFSPGGLLTPDHVTHAIFTAQSQGGLGWEVPQRLGLLLILTAFASGCSAMTGVEAISNGVPAFKPPEANNAARTLVWMIGILVTLYIGTTYLAWRFSIAPYASQNPTVTGQIAGLLFVGPFGFMYYVVQFATLLILVLAANTSFADFPRLSSILARDGFLPHQFSFRGDRLAFTTGIAVLSVLSIVLLVAFKGSTAALINLYALGVFTAFTLSQTGMVFRWRRLARASETPPAGWRRSMIINAVGACVTGVVAVVIIVTKFDRGAWIVVLLVPLIVLNFRAIARHYAAVREHTQVLTPLKAEDLRHIMVVPIADINPPALQALAYARSLTPHVTAIHIALDDEDEAAFRAAWEQFVERRTATLSALAAGGAAKGQRPELARDLLERRTKLVVIRSPYRSLVSPLKAYVDALRDANPNATVSVVLPEFVPAHWWEEPLHNQTALRLKFALRSDRGVVVINVPNQLGRRAGTAR